MVQRGSNGEMQWRARKAFIFYVFFLFIVYVHILWLMLCTWQCLNMYLWFALSLVLLCPCCILYPWCDNFSVLASVKCWTCKWYFAFKLINLHVWMFIPYVNEHCDHYSIVIACMIKPWSIALFHFTWSHCLLHMHYKFFYIQWSNCVVVFQEILVLMIQELHRF